MTLFNIKISPIIMIFTLALLLRVSTAFFMNIPIDKETDGVWIDTVEYNIIAQNIVSGNGFAYGENKLTAFRPPLFPLFIAAIYYLFGFNYIIAIIFIIFLGSLIPLLIFQVSIYLFDKQSAITSAIIAAIYPPLIYYSRVLMTETLFILLLLITILFLIKSLKGSYLKNIAIAGFFFGLSLLCRTSVIPLLLLIPCWLFLNQSISKTKVLEGAVMFLACVFLVLSPWLYRNYTLYNAFPVFGTNAGMNLYFFEHNELTKNQLTELQKKSSPWIKEIKKIRIKMKNGQPIPNEIPKQTEQFRWLLKHYYEKNLDKPAEMLNEYEIDRALGIQAFNYMANHPDKKLILMFKNAIKFFWVIKYAKNPEDKKINYAYVVLLFFAVAGFYFSRNRWQEFTIIYLTCFSLFIMSVFFHTLDRFRLPVEALFIIMSGFAIRFLFTVNKKSYEKNPNTS